jgi:hypothetical protein
MRVDDIVRTERYFTAGLLVHLLLADNFAGVRELFSLLADRGILSPGTAMAPLAPDTVQVIAELAVRRDLLRLPGIPTIDSEDDVPRDVIDVVVIVGETLVAIEAKFFSPTNLAAIGAQLATQRAALRLLERHADAGIAHVCHVFLSADPTVEATQLWPSDTPDVGVLTWTNIAELAERLQGADAYVTQRLRRALDRYAVEFGDGESGRNWADIEALDAVLQRCQAHGRDVLIGFTGGLAALEARPWSELMRRRYKWDRTAGGVGMKLARNWIRGDQFAAVMARLRKRGDDTGAFLRR